MSQNKVILEQVSKDKKKDYYKVQTNIGEFLISESLIVKYMILKDREFTDEEFTTILKEITFEKYFSKILNYISYQMRSENEIRKYLQDKEASLEIIEVIVDKLKKLNYLDDELLAQSVFKDIVSKMKGPKYLLEKLKSKGISEKIIDNIIKQFTEELQKELMDKLSLKLIEKNKDLPVKKQREKLYTKFLYQGFDSYIVNERINSYELTDESDDLLKKELLRLLRKYEETFTYEIKKKIINKLLLKGFEYKKINYYIGIYRNGGFEE